jgi:hypothetical protein
MVPRYPVFEPMAVRRTVALALVLVVSPACGDETSVPEDATTDADAPDGGADGGVPAPVPPELPRLTPCPDGWRETNDGEVTTCEPWPEGGVEDCGVGEAHFPGESGCTSLGAACTGDRYAADLPAGTIYVDADATSGAGTGTRTDPFGSIADALAVVDSGGTVALSAGVFDEAVMVTAGSFAIVGTCVSETTLTYPSGGEFTSPLTVSGGTVTLRNLRITAASAGVVADGPTSDLTLEGVQIDDVALNGGYAGNGAHLTLRDAAVRDSRAGTDEMNTGRGFNVNGGAAIDLERVVIERMYDIAVIATRPGTTVTARDVAVRHTQPRAHDLVAGRAFEITLGADGDLERVAIEDNHDVAILAGGDGSTVRVANAVVRRTDSRAANMTGGRGMEVARAGSLVLERVTLDENRTLALFAIREGATLSATDVVIRRTRAEEESEDGGRALGVEDRATALMMRAWISDNREVAILVDGSASAELTDLSVLRTASELATGTHGAGLSVQYGATVALTRAQFVENREAGLFVIGEGATLTGMDVEVADTMGWEVSGFGGRGLGVQEGGRAELTRSSLVRNRDTGVFAYQPGSTVVLRDVRILQTDYPTCMPMGCPAPAAGLAAVRGGYIDAERFRIADGALVGIQISQAGTMDLVDGEVSGHPIGASVETADFDIERITTRVDYFDNETNLDTSALPVPEPAAMLDTL